MYSSEIIKQISSHALDEYPFECCGVVLESTLNGEKTLLRCKNIQNEIHESNPEKYPRDAKTAYTISPADLLKINRMTSKGNYRIKAIYHSHPDHEAYFSEEDKLFAIFNDEPAYPETEYIVVSVEKKALKEAVCFSWEDKSKMFSGYAIDLTS